MPGRKKTSYSYLGCIEELHYDSEWIDLELVDKLKHHMSGLSNLLPGLAPAFFILDYTRKGYTTIADTVHHISGYRPEEFLEGGIGFLVDIYQSDDFRVYNEEVFARNTAFLKTIPPAQHSHYLFTYNFRFRTAEKKIAAVQQKNVYITSPATGIPLYCIGLVYDITNIKRDTVMYHRIDYQKEGHQYKVEENYFYPHREDTILTKREVEIARYMSEGLSSPELAQKLYLSEHTIAIHRKNMLRKTNTKNVAEFIRYVVERRII
ncbi:response regulator transcription factor [Phnomibacter sp. MR]|uniref:response regulator transcription factor n=1 Tax=Phnomibacter sp. MR TaxID=3042318 RepID=UPI003A811FF6